MEDNRARLLDLLHEIEALSAKRHRAGRRNYFFAFGLVTFTILSSAAASLAGFLDQPPKLVGVLALIPGILTVVGAQLKIQPRSHWHYRKRSLLNALSTKIKYQTASSPSAEELAAIAEEFTKINLSMEAEWEQHLSLQPRQTVPKDAQPT